MVRFQVSALAQELGIVRSFYIPMLLLVLTLSGCGLLKESQTPEDPNIALAQASVQHPLSPGETEGLVSDVANNWFYGQGLGETILALGTVIVFPPYGVYLAGNAALSLSGYEELRVSEALPDSGEDVWNSLYDGVTSVPGQITATVSGEEFVTKKKADETLARYLHPDNPAQVPAKGENSPVMAGAKQGTVKAWR